jgi:hypothetical protein
MCQLITSRFKGDDLMNRVFNPDKGIIIPTLVAQDRVLVFCARVLHHAKESSANVDDIEKTALYFVLRSGQFMSARQLDELAARSTKRLETGGKTLRYAHLFEPSRREQYDFWCQNAGGMGELATKNLAVS